MGVVSMVMDHRAADDDADQLTGRWRKIIAASPIPPAGSGSFHLLKDDGGRSSRHQLTRIGIERKIWLQVLYPQPDQWPRGSVMSHDLELARLRALVMGGTKGIGNSM
jgi:hypothetical protein